MARPNQPLPPNVMEAIQRGHVIEAIKLMRQAGLGLKEAKEAVDARSMGKPVSGFAASASGPLPPQVVEALQRGHKIEAIRLLREASGLGLKEAKDRVDAYERQEKAMSPMTSPGEVPRSRSAVWWVVGVVIAVLLVYYRMRS